MSLSEFIKNAGWNVYASNNKRQTKYEEDERKKREKQQEKANLYTDTFQNGGGALGVSPVKTKAEIEETAKPKLYSGVSIPDNSWIDLGKKQSRTSELRDYGREWDNESERNQMGNSFGTAPKREYLTDIYQLQKDENLNDKQRKQVVGAIPFMTQKLKDDVARNGGYGTVLNPSYGAKMFTYGRKDGTLMKTHDDLNAAIDLTKRRAAASRGALDSLSFGMTDAAENYMEKKAKENPDNPYFQSPVNKTGKEMALELHPGYYAGGYAGGEIAKYATVSKLAPSIPGIRSISNPFLKGVAADSAVDTVMNAANAGSDLLQGKDFKQAGKDFAKQEAIDVGTNLLMGGIVDRKGLKSLLSPEVIGKSDKTVKKTVGNTVKTAVKNGVETSETALKQTGTKSLRNTMSDSMTKQNLDDYFSENNLFRFFMDQNQNIKSKNHSDFLGDKNPLNLLDRMRKAAANGTYNGTDFTRNIEETFIRNKNPEMQEFGRNLILRLDMSKGEYADFVQNELSNFKKIIMDELGVKPGSKEDKALFRYINGQKKLGVKDGEVVTSPYGFDDLVKEVGLDKAEQFDQIAKPYFRERMDVAYDLTNASRAQIYPEIRKQYDEQIEFLTGKIETYGKEAENFQNAARKSEDLILSKKAELEGKLEGTKDYVALQNQIIQMEEQKEWFLKEYKNRMDSVTNLTTKRNEIETGLKDGSLLRNKELPYRSDYIHHYQEKRGGLSEIISALKENRGIAPELYGISETTKPKSKWQSIFQRQGKGDYTESAIGAFREYIPQAGQAIYIDPMVKLFRDMETNLRQAKEVVNDKTANALIGFFSDFSNDLAGKTSNFGLDPLIRKDETRQIPALLDAMDNQVKRSSVMFNLRTALVQPLNYTQTIANLKNPSYLMGGIQDTAKGIMGDKKINQLYEQSAFLKERYLEKILNQYDSGAIRKIENAAGAFMRVPEEITVRASWNGFYRKAIAEHISNPIHYADVMTRKMHAGRGIGEVPLALKSRTMRYISPFMIEPQNLNNVIRDMFKGADHINKKGKNTMDIGGLFSLFVLSALTNEVFEKTTGSGVMIDPFGSAAEGYRKTEGNALQKTGGAAKSVLSDVVTNLPGGNAVASVLPETIRDGLFGENSINTRYGTASLIGSAITKPIENLQKKDYGKAALNLGTTFLLPFGGSQVRKTVEGLQTYNQGGAYNDKGQLQYPVNQTGGNLARGALFGKSSFPSAQEYYDNGAKPLSKNRTDVYNSLKNGENNVDLYNAFVKENQKLSGGNSGDATAQQLQEIAQFNEQNEKNTYFLPTYLDEDKTEVKIGKKKYEMNAAQKDWYNQNVGNVVAQAIQNAINDPSFSGKSITKKNDYLKKAKQKAEEKLKKEALGR